MSTFRFFRQFLAPRDHEVVAMEATYRRGDDVLPATIYHPRAVRAPLPGWTTLHGLTYHGREHASLQRLARALAASGSVVLVPDVPEWRALRVAPATTVDTIKAAVLALDALGLSAAGRVGVIGFSFGATQALIAATDPALHGRLAGVAAWGGYSDLATVTRYLFLGEAEGGVPVRAPGPDPYGRWILAGNYLGLLDEYARSPALAESLLWLAREAGRRRIMAWEPAMDPLKGQARRRLAPQDQAVYDMLAPPAGTALTHRQRDTLRPLVDRMLAAARAAEPLLDPTPFLPRVPTPVFLAHGRGDRLVPWTEMLELRRRLPADRVRASGVTALFAHSVGERRRLSYATAREAARFVFLMRRMLRLI